VLEALIRFLREQSGVTCCAHETACFIKLVAILEKTRFSCQRTHDSALGVTLLKHGEKTFHTRNEKDFADIAFQKVVNAVD
jgi:hypothetical protein